MPNNKKGNWIVKMRRTVITNVFCEDCTLEEAQTNPFDYAYEETEANQEDYEVIKVESNE